MSQLLRLLRSNSGRLNPLNTLFPSNAVFDVDATLAASYTSGQVWKNLIKAPADGAAQTAYDWNRGTTSGSEGTDPTFTGSPGSPSAYFDLDTDDLFTLAGAATTFFGNLHKKVSHTLIVATRNSPVSNVNIGLFSTTDTLNAANVGMAYTCGFNFGFYRQRETTNINLTTNHNWSTAGFNTALGDKLIIISYDSVTNNITTYINGVAGAPIASGFSASSAALITPGPSLFALGVSNYRQPCRAYGVSMLNKSISAAEAAKLLTFYNTRHGRKYG